MRQGHPRPPPEALRLIRPAGAASTPAEIGGKRNVDEFYRTSSAVAADRTEGEP
jgi:hypothetical protein